MVRWAVIIGVLCTLAAIPLFAAAWKASQAPDSKTDTENKRLAQLCAEQAGNGMINEDNPCAKIAGAGTNEATKAAVAGGVLAILGIAQLIGAVRLGVTVTGPGVIIRNPLRTFRLEWGDIDEFTSEMGHTGRLTYAFGRVTLVNGDTHRIEAICMMPWESKAGFQDERALDALNKRLRQHRAAASDEATA